MGSCCTLIKCVGSPLQRVKRTNIHFHSRESKLATKKVPEQKVEIIKFDPESTACKLLIEHSKTYAPDTVGSTGGKNAVYGQVLEDAEGQTFKYPCHKNMAVAHGNKLKTVWSLLCRPLKTVLDPEIVNAYFNWILDPEISPWHSLLGMQKEIIYEGLKCTDLEFQMKYGFVFTNIHEIPSNLIMNFFVATRMPKEWPIAIKTWHMLTADYGVDPAVALFYVRLFYANPEKPDSSGRDANHINPSIKDPRIQLLNNNFYDWPLDTVSSEVNYFSNFVFGTPVHLEHPFTDKEKYPAYDHINNVWGETNWYDHNEWVYRGMEINGKGTYSKYIYDAYSPSIGSYVKTESNVGSKRDDKGILSWRLTFDDVISIIKKEEERLVSVASVKSESPESSAA